MHTAHCSASACAFSFDCERDFTGAGAAGEGAEVGAGEGAEGEAAGVDTAEDLMFSCAASSVDSSSGTTFGPCWLGGG